MAKMTKAVAPVRFNPITITVTLESDAEVHAFYAAMNTSPHSRHKCIPVSESLDQHFNYELFNMAIDGLWGATASTLK